MIKHVVNIFFNIKLLIIVFLIGIFASCQHKSVNIEHNTEITELIDTITKHETTIGKVSAFYDFVNLADSLLIEYKSANQIDSFYLDNYLRITQCKKELGLKDAIFELQNISDQAKELNLNNIYARATNERATILYNLGFYDESLPLFLESIEIFEQNEDWMAYSYALNDVGNLYFQQAMFEMAKEYFDLSKVGYDNFEDELDRNYGFAVYENNLALVAVEQKDFSLAENHFRKGLHYRKLAKRNNLLSDSYIYLAKTKDAMGLIDSMMFYLHKAMLTDSSLNLIEEYINSTRLYAYYLARTPGESENSLKYYVRAKRLANKYNINKDKALIYLGIGGYFARKYQGDSANYYGWAADSIAKINNQKRNRWSALKFLRGNYSYEKKWEDYGKVLDIMLELSLNNDKNKNDDEALKAQVRFEAEKRKKEEELRKKQKKLNLIINILYAAIVSILFLYTIILLRSRNKIKIQEQKLNKALAKEQKLKAYQRDMTNMIIHDLKGPLNTIINVKTVQSIDPELKMIQQAGYQMDNLVMNILDVYKHEFGQIIINSSEENFVYIIQNSISQVDFNAKSKNINFTITELTECIISVDKEMITRVITNILLNAINYSPKNDTIEISAKIKDRLLRIGILNNGPSIPNEMQQEIFKHFINSNQPNSAQKSTGLGLTFCKIAVESHGGEIGVISEPDMPVEFWFTLPNLISYSESSNKIETSNDKQETKLNSNDIDFLTPYAKKMSEYKIYNISEIVNCLSSIPADDEAVIDWVRKVKQAAFEANSENYKYLLQLVLMGRK